jgi:DNA repair exonuclease SbcCD ATPase subunit
MGLLAGNLSGRGRTQESDTGMGNTGIGNTGEPDNCDKIQEAIDVLDEFKKDQEALRDEMIKRRDELRDQERALKGRLEELQDFINPSQAADPNDFPDIAKKLRQIESQIEPVYVLSENSRSNISSANLKILVLTAEKVTCELKK